MLLRNNQGVVLSDKKWYIDSKTAFYFRCIFYSYFSVYAFQNLLKQMCYFQFICQRLNKRKQSILSLKYVQKSMMYQFNRAHTYSIFMNFCNSFFLKRKILLYHESLGEKPSLKSVYYRCNTLESIVYNQSCI